MVRCSFLNSASLAGLCAVLSALCVLLPVSSSGRTERRSDDVHQPDHGRCCVVCVCPRVLKCVQVGLGTSIFLMRNIRDQYWTRAELLLIQIVVVGLYPFAILTNFDGAIVLLTCLSECCSNRRSERCDVSWHSSAQPARCH